MPYLSVSLVASNPLVIHKETVSALQLGCRTIYKLILLWFYLLPVRPPPFHSRVRQGETEFTALWEHS